MITGDMSTERYGYINTQGQWVVPPKLLFAKDFQEGVAAVGLATDTGFTDIHGNQIVAAPDPNGDNGEGVMEGYYLDTSGQIVLAPIICQSGKFAGCEITGKGNFSEGLASANVFGTGGGRGTGFIDKSGNLVIEPQRSLKVGEFSEGIVDVELRETDLTGYMDRTGRIIAEPQFNSGWSFSGGVAKVNFSVKVKSARSKQFVSKNKFTYVNTQGKLIVPPQFDDCEDFTEGRGIVEINNDYGCLDTSGRCVVEPQFKYMGKYSGGLSHTALDDGQWGFIDLDGNMAISFKFEDATPFREGLAAVKLNGKWGFIDHAGEFVIDPTYDAINAFTNCNYNVMASAEHEEQGLYKSLTRNVGFFDGIARVVQDGMCFFIDVNNNLLASQGFDDTYRFDNGQCLVKSYTNEDWKIGFMDKSGQVHYFQIPAEYAGLLVRYNWYEHVPFYKELSNPFREGLLKVSSRRKMIEEINPYRSPCLS
jgi:WG containing repeat